MNQGLENWKAIKVKLAGIMIQIYFLIESKGLNIKISWKPSMIKINVRCQLKIAWILREYL